MYIYIYIYIYIFVCVSLNTSLSIPLSLSLSLWGHLRVVIVKALDYGIVESEIELQSRYQVHFRTNKFGKNMKTPYLPIDG